MRATLLLAAMALPFAACSGVATYELALHGDARLNPNDDNQPNAVQVKVLRLKGEESAKAFLNAQFDALWSDPITAENVVVDGTPQKLYVKPQDERVPVSLKSVPAEVSAIGVMGLFNNPLPGKDRVIIMRPDFGTLEVWLHDNVIDTQPPAAPTAAGSGDQPGS